MPLIQAFGGRMCHLIKCVCPSQRTELSRNAYFAGGATKQCCCPFGIVDKVLIVLLPKVVESFSSDIFLLPIRTEHHFLLLKLRVNPFLLPSNNGFHVLSKFDKDLPPSLNKISIICHDLTGKTQTSLR